MEYTQFTDEKRNPLHLLIRNGVHTSYIVKTFNLGRWNAQHLLMREGVNSVYS